MSDDVTPYEETPPPEIPTELHDLQEHVAAFIYTVDLAIGREIDQTPERNAWSRALACIDSGETSLAGKVGACNYALRSLDQQPDLIVGVPRILRKMLEGHMTMETLLRSDVVLVDLLPTLIARWRLTRGTDFYEEVVRRIEGDADA